MLDDSFRSSPGFLARKTIFARLGYWAINYSRVLQVINQAKNLIRTQVRDVRREAASVSDAGEELGLDSMVYLEPKNSVWKEAWRVTEGLILLMRDEVREKGADFLVVTLSNGIQVYPDPSVREAFSKRLRVNNLFYPDSRIASLGAREGFPVINLAPLFQTYAERHKIFLHGFGNKMGKGHWNAAGHRLAGETIARKICPNIAPKQNAAMLH